MKIRIQRLKEDVPMPYYKHEGDAGMDLVNMGKDFILKPFERTLLPTGIKVSIPYGYELQIRPRSGMALKKGLTLLNTPGTIDSGYRGEIGLIVYNANRDEEIKIEHKERIAQAVLKKVEQIEWLECDDLDETVRASGGFGSTGSKE